MQKSVLATAALVLPLLAGCAASAPKAPKVADANVVEIAVAGPMSGELAAFGEQLRKGAEQAVADINKAGGVNGKMLHLNIGDDQCEPRRAVDVAENMVDEGVKFVVGHFCSGSSIPASKVYGAQNILQITPSSTNPALTDDAASDGITTVLRTGGRDDRQGDFAAAWLAKDYAGQAVAVVDDGSAYGSGITEVLVRRLNGAPVTLAVRATFKPRERNFTSLIADMKAKNVKAVFIGGYHDEAAALAKAMRSNGVTAALAGPDALNTSEFWSLAGSAGEGVRYVDAPATVDRESAKAVVAAFRADGYEPEGYTLNTYAAVQAFAAAAKGTNSFDGKAMGAWLRANSVPTALGTYAWDGKGDVKDITYAWYVFRDGRAYAE